MMTMMTLFTNMDLDSNAKPSRSLQSYANEQNSQVAGGERKPASVVERSQLSIDKEFFCKTNSAVRHSRTQQGMVMINFSFCLAEKLIKSVNLKNETNGFVAQIFQLGENKFKTDYIQLTEGLNNLQLEVILKDGQKLQESLEILSGS